MGDGGDALLLGGDSEWEKKQGGEGSTDISPLRADNVLGRRAAEDEAVQGTGKTTGCGDASTYAAGVGALQAADRWAVQQPEPEGSLKGAPRDKTTRARH